MPDTAASLRFHAAEETDDALFKYAVIAARYKGRWVFCKNKRRQWELPGGHREAGENILDTAKRELFEETGAVRYGITPVSAYTIHNCGMLFFAEIEEMGALPDFEIESVGFFDGCPQDLSFPLHHPAMLEKVKETLRECPRDGA